MTANFSGFCRNCNQSYPAGTNITRDARTGKWVHFSCPIAAPAPAAWNEDTDEAPEDPNSPHFCRGASCSCRRPQAAPAARPQAALDADEIAAEAYANRDLTPEDQGVYALRDGSIVNIKKTRDGQRVYPELWTVISGIRQTEAGTVEHGEYVYNENASARFELRRRVAAEGHKLTEAEVKAFAIRFGVCCRCAADLSDALSVRLGIGPVCIKYVDYPAEAVAAAKAAIKAATRPAAKAAKVEAPAPSTPAEQGDHFDALAGRFVASEHKASDWNPARTREQSRRALEAYDRDVEAYLARKLGGQATRDQGAA